MRCQDEIIAQLRLLSTDVNCLYNVGWWYFKYGSFQMIYIPGDAPSNTIRICIPHFGSANQYDSERLTAAINETNREVRFVKVAVLSNGSISINYDHKCEAEKGVCLILQHILNSLCFAAEYLKNKLAEN